jgi:hypothetical protein
VGRVVDDDHARRRLSSHHEELVRALTGAVDAFAEAIGGNGPAAAVRTAAGALEARLAQDVLPHAAGEEVTLYARAQDLDGRLVALLLGEHEELRRLVEACRRQGRRLDGVAERLGYLGLAHQVLALFRSHAAKEDGHLVPLLLEGTEPGTLGRLFGAMHRVPDPAPPGDAAI